MKFNALVPELIVSELSRSLSFYRDLLGFDVVYDRPEERFAFLAFDDAQLMLLEDNDNQHSRTGDLKYPRGRGINFSIRTQRLDRVNASLKAAGHPLRIPVREQWHRQDDLLHGERQLWVMDPDGYLLRLIESLGTRPAEHS